MPFQVIKNNNISWYNFANVDKEDLKILTNKFKVHSLSLHDIHSSQENPKLDVFKDHLFGLFHFPTEDLSSRRIYVNEINLFIGRDYIITIQEKKFPILEKLFKKTKRSQNKKKEIIGIDTNIFFYNLLKNLFVITYEPIVDDMAKKIKSLEKNIYDKENLAKALKEIGILRRNILNLKSMISPQMNIIHTISTMDNNIIKNKYVEYFDDVDDYMERIWSIAKNQHELIEGLYLTTESLISYKTNEVIKLLTIFSVAILPLTLLSGLYGMNIDLPFQNEPNRVWIVFLSLLLVIITFLFLFLRKRK